ncbi:MAG: hypothetical protein KU37_03035 [Sulfuricurvum sp. PC08-66]|nr:MAG: hypothetical protein KU37_03035 [Sulfuricurvum sp. PC08-66]
MKNSALTQTLLFKIVLFFVGVLLASFLAIGAIVVDRHYTMLVEQMRGSLAVMAEDIVYHDLVHIEDTNLMHELMMREVYHSQAMATRYEGLDMRVTQTPPPFEKNSIYVARPIEGETVLYIWASDAPIMRDVSRYMLYITIAFALIATLMVITLIGYLLHLFRPMRCLVAFCHDFDPQNGVKPSCEGSLEIAQLQNAIVTLLDENKALCNKERDIFKEAAHELKTPLAILKSRLGLYKERDSYEKARFIEEAQEDLDTIVLRLQELLFLKNIEMEMRSKKVSMDILMQCDTLQSAFRPIVEKKELMMTPVRKGSFTIHTHEKALGRVLLAIFENIFIHAQSKSTIEVTIDAQERTLTIVNTIATHDDDKLFSSSIGTQIIERLSERLGYTYTTQTKGEFFITQLRFEEH